MPAEYKPHSDPFLLLAISGIIIGTTVFQAFALAKENTFVVMLHTTTSWPEGSQGSTTVFMLYQDSIIKLGLDNIRKVRLAILQQQKSRGNHQAMHQVLWIDFVKKKWKWKVFSFFIE